MDRVVVPAGWTQCPRMSDGLVAGKFLVVKVPLDSKYPMEAEERFGPEYVFEYLREMEVR